MHYKYKKFIVLINQKFRGFWNHSSGDWTWLADNPVPVATLNRSLWRGAVPSINFYNLLFLSTVISTLGLLANSAATIIGAMIVAPLMGPIIAITYGVVSGNRRLLRRASLTLASGILLCAITSLLISRLVGLSSLGSEINARITPTLIDLGVAIAAGAAGAFAKSRRAVADALPGVAIAVALVPPLSVVGIGLARGSSEISSGAALLFATNLIGIIFSGAIVFLWQRYGSFSRAKGGLLISIFLLIILAIPLGFSLKNLIIRQQTYDQVLKVITTNPIFPQSELQSLRVNKRNEVIFVQIDLITSDNSINQQKIATARNFLAQELETKIHLTVKTIPINTYSSFD